MIPFLVAASALASPTVPVVADHNAQALAFGEVMIGTSGAHVGVLPGLQLGTRPWIDLLGLPNLSGRFQVVDTPRFDLAADGSFVVAGVSGWSMTGAGGGVQSSVHLGRGSVHLGLHTFHLASVGLPDRTPTWIASIVGSDPLADLAAQAAAEGIVPEAQVGLVSLKAAGELRVTATGGLLLQGSANVAGHSRVSVATDYEGFSLDVGPGLPGVQMLDRASTPAGSWVASLSWQQQLGPVHLRAGAGASAVEYAWLGQAAAIHVRGGGFNKRDHVIVEADGADGGGDAAADVLPEDIDITEEASF